MTGIIDVGGGLRDIYGAGIFDYCLDNGIQFDYCIGVSAGSANIASYIAGQRGRNYRFYMEYAFRRQYMSLQNLIHTGSYIDMDYAYGELSKKNG
ncbi:MAG: patatin-like phospholipase family protein, partial [Oscillospiraceae bacterium]